MAPFVCGSTRITLQSTLAGEAVRGYGRGPPGSGAVLPSGRFPLSGQLLGSVNLVRCDLDSSAKLTLDTYGHILEEGHRLDLEATLQKLEDASRGATRVLPSLKLEEGTKAETLHRTGAGDRTRTDDLRITRTQSSPSHE